MSLKFLKNLFPTMVKWRKITWEFEIAKDIVFEKYDDHQIWEYEDHHINIYDDKVYDHMKKSLYQGEMEENGVNYGAGKACTDWEDVQTPSVCRCLALVKLPGLKLACSFELPRAWISNFGADAKFNLCDVKKKHLPHLVKFPMILEKITAVKLWNRPRD